MISMPLRAESVQLSSNLLASVNLYAPARADIAAPAEMAPKPKPQPPPCCFGIAQRGLQRTPGKGGGLLSGRRADRG
jgi:hypothetical protein